MVDEFATVVGMKAANVERKLFQDRFQDRQQPRFPNLRRAPHHLPLRHLVNSIDVVHPLGSVQVSLMHRVHTQVAGLALRIRSPALPNCHRRWTRCHIAHAPLPIPSVLAQVVQVRHRERRQALIVRLPELVILPLQNASGRRPAQRFVRLIHRRQQFDIRARVTLRKPMTTIAALLHLPVLAEPPHQPVHLRTTQTRHLDQVPQEQPAHGFRLFLVLLRPQGPFYPAVNLFPVQRPQANFLAGRQKPLDLLDCERFGSLHCHLHRPAVSPLAPTPPLSGLQHHLALETPALLSIILYWKRLRGSQRMELL